jgi:hypothetical protein
MVKRFLSYMALLCYLILFFCNYSYLSAATQPEVDGLLALQELSQEEVYVGQQLTYSLNLLYNRSINNIQVSDISIPKTWRESLAEERGAKLYLGKEYKNVTFRSALYPLDTGQYTAPEKTLTLDIVEIIDRELGSISGGLFGGLFIQHTAKRVTLRATPISFFAKELPSPPENFIFSDWGSSHVLVGETIIRFYVDKNLAQTGENISAILEIESLGNLAPIKRAPKFIELDNFKVYEGNQKNSKREESKHLIWNKSFTINFIPLKAGSYVIAPPSVEYFSPETKQYQRAQAKSIKIEVYGTAIINQNLVSEESQIANLEEEKQEQQKNNLDLLPEKSFFLIKHLRIENILYLLTLMFFTVFLIYKAKKRYSSNIISVYSTSVKKNIDVDTAHELRALLLSLASQINERAVTVDEIFFLKSLDNFTGNERRELINLLNHLELLSFSKVTDKNLMSIVERMYDKLNERLSKNS